MFWPRLSESLFSSSWSESFSILRTEIKIKHIQNGPNADATMINNKYHNGGFFTNRNTIGVIVVSNAVKNATIAV